MSALQGDTGRFSTLVFDLDGTLTDPSLGISRCINYALETHSLGAFECARIAQEIGPPLDEILRNLRPDLAPNAIHSLVAAYRERYRRVGYTENELYPGIDSALRGLAEGGIRMGVCTSKPKPSAERVLEFLGIRELLDFVDGGDIGLAKREQLRGLIADRIIDIDAVMIGDRGVDIAAARTNGLNSIGILWGFGSREELVAAGPTHLASDVAALTRIVAAPVGRMRNEAGHEARQ